MRALICLTALTFATGCGRDEPPPVTYNVRTSPEFDVLHYVEGEATNATGVTRNVYVEIGCQGIRHSIATLHDVPPGGTAQFSETGMCSDEPASILSTSYGDP